MLSAAKSAARPARLEAKCILEPRGNHFGRKIWDSSFQLPPLLNSFSCTAISSFLTCRFINQARSVYSLISCVWAVRKGCWVGHSLSRALKIAPGRAEQGKPWGSCSDWKAVPLCVSAIDAGRRVAVIMNAIRITRALWMHSITFIPCYSHLSDPIPFSLGSSHWLGLKRVDTLQGTQCCWENQPSMRCIKAAILTWS